ncbi:hypothetical protein [Salipiger mucosus]|uniref:Uncharacterized protein n=1 Tax=Salipiger mucosus DSM 16094 TaxID=1123237 RepID=S9RZI1_9RHOB|nr:hypothetical protein [Salipiger mucosus]EPX83420.1 hypothetical protein Salmuc_02028 [Salipiger mucosus DSM 16094]
MTADTNVKELEQLKAKHKELERKKMAADAEITQHERARAELVSEMKEKFGVDNVDDLRALYEKLLEEDNAKVAAFREQINGISERLASLEAA